MVSFWSFDRHSFRSFYLKCFDKPGLSKKLVQFRQGSLKRAGDNVKGKFIVNDFPFTFVLARLMFQYDFKSILFVAVFQGYEVYAICITR
jgi:hypothetical protein